MRLGLMQFLLGVAATGTYVARWSDAVYAELSKKLPRRPEPIRTRLVAALAAVPDPVIVVTAADEDRAAGGCDTEDVHVLAAAFAGRRLVTEDPGRWGDALVYLVTGDLGHFDEAFARERGVQVLGPDEFGRTLLELNPAAVLRTVQRVPSARYEGYLQRMRDDGMRATAAEIECLSDQLA